MLTKRRMNLQLKNTRIYNEDIYLIMVIIFDDNWTYFSFRGGRNRASSSPATVYIKNYHEKGSGSRYCRNPLICSVILGTLYQYLKICSPELYGITGWLISGRMVGQTHVRIWSVAWRDWEYANSCQEIYFKWSSKFSFIQTKRKVELLQISFSYLLTSKNNTISIIPLSHPVN